MTGKRYKFYSEHYKELFSCAREIVYKYDPIGITGDGDAPEDEYDKEISKILPFLNKGLTIDELSYQIALVFHKSFGSGPMKSHEGYKPLAIALIKMIKNKKSS